MKDSRLTLRELRILHETERVLLRDARLAEAFREFRECAGPGPGRGLEGGVPPGTVPDADPGPSRRLWLLVGVCAFLVPVLMILHPGVGALVLLSVLTVCAARWVDRRRGRGAG